MSKKNNNRVNVVYSTNPNYNYEEARAGKEVTLVEGFVGSDEDLKELGKLLKSKCGVGGSAKDGEILIQGKLKQKVYDLLITAGYSQTKQKGGN